MTVVVDTCADVNLETLRRVALEGERVRLSDRAAGHIAAVHTRFQDHVATHADGFIYMVTAGAGPDAKSHYSLEQARERRRRQPFLGLSFGGANLPQYVSRAAIFAGISMLVSGHSATHPARAQAMVEMLDGELPRLPTRGLVAAGELMSNFVLQTRSSLSIADEGFSAGTGNGSPASSAMAGLAALFARRRLELSEVVFALSIEAIRAPLSAYHPALKELWKDPFAALALDRLGDLLDGASLTRRNGTAPASYRVLPRLLGQARRSLATLEAVATVALSQGVSNPAFIFAPLPAAGEPVQARRDGPVGQETTVSNGSYHNSSAAPAIDSMSASWVELGAIAHRHAVKLHKGGVSQLPDRLLPPGTDYVTGYSTTYLEYVPNQALEEMRRLAQPTLLSPAETAASEQDDVAITAPVAFVAEREVSSRLDEVLAVLAVICSQAIHLTGFAVAPRLETLLDFVRDVVAPVESRRQLGQECGRLAGAISAAIEHGGPELSRLSATRLDT
ncbi:MAG: aromatic amino acid lyase [Acidimicrobiales bacterium]